ncbi:unnamed protein product [Miscanthus lutarioriparius]|uniref:Uncharacterized protein n=1 Tax=Miscanthus lutarioriparius TaxID=422564 RepID=A0A811Q8J0_9POAL|nr:unnamed protein product [Miscanthus lutarioriparius]
MPPIRDVEVIFLRVTIQNYARRTCLHFSNQSMILDRYLYENPKLIIPFRSIRSDEVGFLHPTQFCSLEDDDSNSQHSEPHHTRYLWCRDHKLAISAEILPRLYRAARDAYCNARDAPLSPTHLMRHTKALLILCPDLLTAWNSRNMVLSAEYDFTKLKDELQLCALILSYSPKNESTWSHRRWVIKQVAEQHQDMSEIIENESILVKEIAEKSKMNYRAWRHRCWLIPYMTRKQVLDELKKSTKWSELHVADNCCFHYRRSLLLTLLESRLGNGEDSLSWESETYLLWKEELRWDEMLIRRYQGRESLWNHRRFLSQWWIQRLLTVEETCPSTMSQVDLFVSQEIYLLSECLNDPEDEFDESPSPGIEREAGRKAAFHFPGEAVGRGGKSLQAGEEAVVDESAGLG